MAVLKGKNLLPLSKFFPLRVVPILEAILSIVFKIFPECSKKFLSGYATEHITKTRLFKYIEKFTTKNWNFSDEKFDIFHTSAQNIDCGYSLEAPRRGGSNEYPQSMFLSRDTKNNVYPCKPQFKHIKVGSKSYRYVFVMSTVAKTDIQLNVNSTKIFGTMQFF